MFSDLTVLDEKLYNSIVNSIGAFLKKINQLELFDSLYTKNYSKAEYTFLFFNITYLLDFKKYGIYHIKQKNIYHENENVESKKQWISSITFEDVEFHVFKNLSSDEMLEHKGISLVDLVKVISENENDKNDKFNYSYNKDMDKLFYLDKEVEPLSVNILSYLLKMYEDGMYYSGEMYVYLRNEKIILRIMISTKEEKNMTIECDLLDKKSSSDFEKEICLIYEGYKVFGFYFLSYLSALKNKRLHGELGYFIEIENWINTGRYNEIKYPLIIEEI